MNNAAFLQVLQDSFKTYLKTSPRSNEKLRVLHGSISDDLSSRLGTGYIVDSINTNNRGKEDCILGRYIEKKVDITVKSYDRKTLAGIAVKYVMSNYSQNSNNYFENMLGETANIRSAGYPYFQMFIIPSKIPYFDREKRITKWEHISSHNLKKYVELSKDNIDRFMHTPNKTLVCIIDIVSSTLSSNISTQDEYVNFYLNSPFEMKMNDSNIAFDNSVIYNDYERFIQKVVYAIKSI